MREVSEVAQLVEVLAITCTPHRGSGFPPTSTNPSITLGSEDWFQTYLDLSIDYPPQIIL